MVAWKELLDETSAAGSVHDVIRRKYLRKLQQYTKRNTIIYYSGWLQKPHLLSERAISLGISDADKNGFMAAVHQLDRKRGLDLVLHTPGGDMAATESLIDYLRLMFNSDVRAIVPQIAMSGGTIMALSCEKIVMGRHSNIGPIDPQFGAIAANSFLQEIEKIRNQIKEDPRNALLWQPVLQKIDPGFITLCESALEWSQNMSRKFLSSGMFRSDAEANSKIDIIISHLTEAKTTVNHGRHIGLDEAKQIFGEHIIELEADQRLQDLVLSVHHATIVTLQATAAYKIIENHLGRAFMQAAQMQIIGTPA